MQLFIIGLEGKENVVNIEENSTIYSLKMRLLVNDTNVGLIFQSKELKDECKICDTHLINGSVVHMIHTGGLLMGDGVPFIEVTMFCTKGHVTEKLELELNPHVPISGIKSDLAYRLGIAAENQRLIFNGRVLPDTSTLMECEVQSGGKLIVEDGGT